MDELENTIRDNGSRVTSQPYSKENIKWLQRLIYDAFKDGRPKIYDIRINNEIVVPKNDDSRKFDGYLKYVNPTTQVVEVRLYQGNSPNCNNYLFVTEQANSLAGPENVSSQIQKALEEDRRKRELVDLKAENDKLKRKNKKLKVGAQKGLPMQQLRGLLTDVGAAYQTIKGVRPMAGVDQENLSQDDEEYSEVEVEVEGEESEADEVYQMVKEKLGEQNTITCYQMINELGQHPDLFKKMQHELAQRNESK